ncbi:MULTISPECIES: hypothetical protein [Rhodopseudomonas]|uniref:Uncharacterized protein n=1 Tax=Rhodopseudomonas palustris TaxID=1076 RepID=A0A0D7EHP4_RHOPL|nr:MULTISPECIES: hypothetical protein [Rhodopseudomonas]KIZ39052.1 hypothetical protein OO17_21580 [Rhodopseudomonas palustris]MDF3809279.1 hypothetical protein [Rhodopseudomonas sp. BAL398]WOK19037.1 hypothetical protein RBJ75_05830 [Rhodopseudomonas sp. BAL398]
MGNATAETLHRVRVAASRDGSVMIVGYGQEDAKIMLDCPEEIARQLTLDLIAAGYGPSQRGGQA